MSASIVTGLLITRRNWVRSAIMPAAAVLAACGRKRSPRYQGYALIANRSGRTLAVIDLSRFQTLQRISLNAAPSWVIAAPSQDRAFIFSAGSAAMSVLDLDSMTLKADVPLGGKPQAVRLGSDPGILWVLLTAPNELAAFQTSSGRLITRVRLPSVGVDMDEWEGRVSIAFRDDRHIGCYRTDSRTFRLSAPLDAGPSLIRVRADGKVLLTGNTEGRSITAIDAATLQPMVDLPLPIAPKHFCFNSDGGQLFVTGDGMDAVVIVSPYQTEIDETILAGKAPGKMAVTTSSPSYLLVANPQSGDITIINIDNRRVLAQIPVGQQPGTVLLTPDNEYALVLNELSGDVAVLRLQSIRAASPENRRTRMASIFTLIPVGSEPVSGVVMPRSI